MICPIAVGSGAQQRTVLRSHHVLGPESSSCPVGAALINHLEKAIDSSRVRNFVTIVYLAAKRFP